MAVEGYFHTHSFRKYALRLALFAVLSEVPFDLMYGGTWFYPFHQNVIWTLLIGLSGIHLMEKTRKKQKLTIFLPTAVLVVLVGSALGTVGMADYYGAGVLTLFIFYVFRGRNGGVLPDSILEAARGGRTMQKYSEMSKRTASGCQERAGSAVCRNQRHRDLPLICHVVNRQLIS